MNCRIVKSNALCVTIAIGTILKRARVKPIVFMTGFKLMVTLQSGCVIEILTLCRIHEIFFSKIP